MIVQTIVQLQNIGSIEFGSYNGYLTWPYQVVGVTSSLLVFGVVFAGVLDARLFGFLISNYDDDSNSDWANVEMKEQNEDDRSRERGQPLTDYSNMDDYSLETPKEAAAKTAAASAAAADTVLV